MTMLFSIQRKGGAVGRRVYATVATTLGSGSPGSAPWCTRRPPCSHHSAGSLALRTHRVRRCLARCTALSRLEPRRLGWQPRDRRRGPGDTRYVERPCWELRTRQAVDCFFSITFFNRIFHAVNSGVRFACPMRIHHQLGLVVRCGDLAL